MRPTVIELQLPLNLKRVCILSKLKVQDLLYKERIAQNATVQFTYSLNIQYKYTYIQTCTYAHMHIVYIS